MMNVQHYNRFYLLLLFGYSLAFDTVLGFHVPSPQNDHETNRVLEEFIWQKIIGAPTDPKKAYQELRSSLAAISAESNIDQIKLPDSLFSIGSILSPRSLRRRSSYSSPDSGSGSTTTASSSPSSSSSPSAESQLFNSPSTSNKYIPEYGAKELYTLVAAAAGSPDAPQPQLPPPPPPSRTKASQLSSSTTVNHNPQEQQEILKEAMRKNSSINNNKKPALSQNKSISSSYNGPINPKHYFTLHKVMKHSKKSVPQLTAVSKHQSKSELNGESSESGTIRRHQHQPAQSRSIYDILPMPTYGSIKGGMDQYQPNQSFEESDNDHGIIQNGGYIPPSSGSLAPPFEAKRTFEIVPLIEQKVIQQQKVPERDHYVPVQPSLSPPEPQIIDVIPDEQPIQIVFRSSSARVNVKQIHMPVIHQEVETTRTEEKPQRVLHQLVRPIVQEVVEIIQPYRRVTQEIRPVLEEIRTVVAKQTETHRPRIEQLGSGTKW